MHHDNYTTNPLVQEFKISKHEKSSSLSKVIKNFFFLYDKYWVGQKVHLGFSVTSYGKTRTNFLANPVS